MYYTYYIILRINTIQNNTGVPDPNAWRQYWRESRGLAGMADQAALMDVESAGEEELEVGARPLQVPLAQAMAVQKLDAKANHEKGLAIYAPLRDEDPT